MLDPLNEEVKEIQGVTFVAERIRKAVETKTIQAYDTTVNVTISIGFARFPVDGGAVLDLMDKADTALYRAKSDGRNCVRGFTDKNGLDI